ncbi:hypothetical protein SK128_000357 [Halocaridina rubra]|uniref:C2H2-type domain-containing protein n=1 Tax=Halocaridina rubra TaxID=373956 RepID=A0AAN8XIK5_HALRR
MEGLTLDVTTLGDAGAQMITLVDASSLETSQHNVHILAAHQLEPNAGHTLHDHEKDDCDPLGTLENPLAKTAVTSPHCLVCNAKLGVSARGAMALFSDKAKTTHRQIEVHVMLTNILNQDIQDKHIHSSIVCKKCYKLIDDIDSLEGQLITLKQVVTNKYMRTLAIVKQEALQESVDSVLDEDTLHLEASTLTKDDKDFKVYMGSVSSVRGRRSRRGRGGGRGVRTSAVKLEVKQEENVQEFSGLDTSENADLLKHQTLLSTTDSNDALEGRLDGELEDDGGAGMLMVEEEILEESGVVDVVEDVMEVDGLDLEDGDGCVQIDGLPLVPLSGSEMSVQNNPPIQDGHSLLEDGVDRYKCRFCSLKMTVLADIQKHMRESHPERLFECEVCQERMPTKADLVSHLRQHEASGEKHYCCNMCPRRYVLPRQLKEHMRHHMNKTFLCSQCPKRFRSEPALQEHYNAHTGNRPYGCDHCSKKFTSKHILKTHIKTHGIRHRPHQCKTCGKNFLTSHHLSDHVNVHQSKKNYICENCGKGFATQRSLDLHAITHSGVKNFACSICNKLFARKGEVEDHERTHTGEKPFQCEICGSTFSQRSNLQSHKRTTHYQEKRYQCNQCNKAFKRKRLLVYHIMSVHTGERPYKCEKCNAGFVYPEHYKKHLRIHTGEKPFKCEICGKSFNSRDNRNAHKFIHSDKKPYECALCGAGFMRKPMLASHLQQHGHTEDVEAYMKMNPPTIIACDTNTAGGIASPTGTIRSVKIDEDQSLEPSLDTPVQLVRSSVRDGDTVEVMSRPVHIIEADDLPRYIIHATNGDRGEEGVGHLFASLQGQVVEVRADDIERYSELTADQMAQVAQVVSSQPSSSGIHQVAVSGDLRPLHIQLEPATREITLQAQPGSTREVAASIGLPTTTTVSTRDVTLHGGNHVPGTSGTAVLVGSRQLQYDSGALSQSTLRKVLTDRDDIRTTTVLNITTSSESRSTVFRPWPQQTIDTNANNFIGN